jgi:Zn-dependent protease
VNTDVETFLILIPIFLGSMTLHEIAHGYVAYRLGDSTAKLLGRLSPNPMVHLDPLGTAMFAITYFSGSFLFGWAKPVPVDPRNLRGHVQRSMALIGAAGPLMNFVLATLFAIPLAHGSYSLTVTKVLYYAFAVNVVLGVFNLLPVPPLDGSRIVGGFMDRTTYLRWAALDQYGMIVVLCLLVLPVFRTQFLILLQGGTEHVADAIHLIVGGQQIPTPI